MREENEHKNDTSNGLFSSVKYQVFNAGNVTREHMKRWQSLVRTSRWWSMISHSVSFQSNIDNSQLDQTKSGGLSKHRTRVMDYWLLSADWKQEKYHFFQRIKFNCIGWNDAQIQFDEERMREKRQYTSNSFRFHVLNGKNVAHMKCDTMEYVASVACRFPGVSDCRRLDQQRQRFD